MNNKKLFSTLLLSLAAAHSVNAAEELSVAATPVPAAEILEFMKPALEKEGVDLKIHVFTDYIQPNQQVADKQVMMNCFQHKPCENMPPMVVHKYNLLVLVLRLYAH